MTQIEKEELEELRRLAAIGKQLEDNVAAAAESNRRDRETAAEHDRTVAAVRAAIKAEQSEARAKFRKTLKNAGGAALLAGVLAGYAVILSDAVDELSEP